MSDTTMPPHVVAEAASRAIASAAESMSQSMRWFSEALDRDQTQRREMLDLANQQALAFIERFEACALRIEDAMRHPLVVLERAPTPTREEELRARDDKWRGVRELVDDQANDEGLWFQATTAPEAYLQQALRKLHALIEATGRT